MLPSKSEQNPVYMDASTFLCMFFEFMNFLFHLVWNFIQYFLKLSRAIQITFLSISQSVNRMKRNMLKQSVAIIAERS